MARCKLEDEIEQEGCGVSSSKVGLERWADWRLLSMDLGWIEESSPVVSIVDAGKEQSSCSQRMAGGEIGGRETGDDRMIIDRAGWAAGLQKGKRKIVQIR